MSRYRPPRPKSSPYITRHGYEALQAELSFLWKVKRPEVTKKVGEAAAQGDRSENAEYIYGKKQLREIDARIKYLSQRLDVIEVIDRQPKDTDRVFFGAWITLEDDAGSQFQYRIVGADEINAHPEVVANNPANEQSNTPEQISVKNISIDAPLARACIGKHLDDEITITIPKDADQLSVLRLGEAATANHQHSFIIVGIKYLQG